MILCIIYYTVLHTSARRCIVLAVPAKYLRREQKESAMERTTRKLAKIDLTNDSSFFFSVISKTNLGYLWLAFNEMPKNHHIYKEALLLYVVMNFQWDASTSIWEIYFWFVVFFFFSNFFHFVYYRSRLYSVRLKGSMHTAWYSRSMHKVACKDICEPSVCRDGRGGFQQNLENLQEKIFKPNTLVRF